MTPPIPSAAAAIPAAAENLTEESLIMQTEGKEERITGIQSTQEEGMESAGEEEEEIKELKEKRKI